ncbi:MAG: ArnT family glycosyltransferase [Draconibacterium sp.]
MKNKSLITNLLFIGALIFISLAYNYQEILFHRPYSNHTWRQADCLSITMNYYKENLNFFTPEVHWTGDKENGKTMSEFPIIYYTVAQLWKIFGQQEFISRLINILIVFSGLFSLFKLSGRILKDTFWSFFIPLIVFTSPLLIFYTNNFLSNAPAFGLALTGTYFFYRYDEKHNKKWLILSMAFFTLSGLLKITSLIIFMAILGTIVLDGIIKVWNKKQTIKSTLLKIVTFLYVLVVIAVW